MDELIQNAEKSYPMFTQKLQIMYDDKDLEGLMNMAKREKAAATEIPKVVVTEMRRDQEGNEVQTEKLRKSNFIIGGINLK